MLNIEGKPAYRSFRVWNDKDQPERHACIQQISGGQTKERECKEYETFYRLEKTEE